MIAVQERIFSRLADLVRAKGLEHAATEPLAETRFIGGDADDMAALQSASIVRCEQIQGVGPVALFKWNGQHYLSLPLAVPVDLGGDNEAAAISTNVGLACLLLGHEESHLLPQDGYEIVDKVFGRKGKYSLAEIEPFFSTQRCYAIRPSLDACLPAEMWSRSLTICARGIAQSGPPKWLIPVVTDFMDACRDPAARFAGDALLSAARAGSWKHGFLEIYRAIEALFRVMLVEDFVDDFPAQMAGEPRAKILRSVEDRLMWRMREDQALERLVSRMDVPCANAVADCLRVADIQAAAKMIYKTRNRIAHGALFGATLADQEQLIRACLLLLRGVYQGLQIHPLWIPPI